MATIRQETETTQVAWQNSPLFELARVLVRFDHVASIIVNVNRRIIEVARIPFPHD